VRLALARFAQDTRELVVEPAQDFLVVGQPDPLLGPLGASVEPVLEDLADMLGVKVELEVAANDLGHPLGRPQLVAPAMRGRPIE
jgi:hypothetical protein